MRTTLWHILPLDNEVKREAKRDKSGGPTSLSDQNHLEMTANWLKQAHNASPDG
jgi:hypothetical protein